MSAAQGQKFLSALFTAVSPASRTGPSSERLRKEGEMGLDLPSTLPIGWGAELYLEWGTGKSMERRERCFQLPGERWEGKKERPEARKEDRVWPWGILSRLYLWWAIMSAAVFCGTMKHAIFFSPSLQFIWYPKSGNSEWKFEVNVTSNWLGCSLSSWDHSLQ